MSRFFVIGFPADVLITVAAAEFDLSVLGTHPADSPPWCTRQNFRLRRQITAYITRRMNFTSTRTMVGSSFCGIVCSGLLPRNANDDPVVFGVRKALANWNPI